MENRRFVVISRHVTYSVHVHVCIPRCRYSARISSGITSSIVLEYVEISSSSSSSTTTSDALAAGQAIKRRETWPRSRTEKQVDRRRERERERERERKNERQTGGQRDIRATPIELRYRVRRWRTEEAARLGSARQRAQTEAAVA